jgi:hypothetical protein
MNKFLNRMKLTDIFVQFLTPFLQQNNFVLTPFGSESILRDEEHMNALIKRERFKKSNAALMVKFSPDFLCTFERGRRKEIFFVDSKTSLTPVFFQTQITRIRRTAAIAELSRTDIGEIEREAWLVYNSFFPKDKVAIMYAAPYHTRLIVAEWVSNLEPLYTFKADRNLESAGSGTPHVNLHLHRMRRLDEFLLQEFDIKVDEKEYASMLNIVKNWDLNKPAGRVNWTQYNNVINDLRREGCAWLKNRWPQGKPDPNQTTLALDA